MKTLLGFIGAVVVTIFVVLPIAVTLDEMHKKVDGLVNTVEHLADVVAKDRLVIDSQRALLRLQREDLKESTDEEDVTSCIDCGCVQCLVRPESADPLGGGRGRE